MGCILALVEHKDGATMEEVTEGRLFCHGDSSGGKNSTASVNGILQAQLLVMPTIGPSGG